MAQTGCCGACGAEWADHAGRAGILLRRVAQCGGRDILLLCHGLGCRDPQPVRAGAPGFLFETIMFVRTGKRCTWCLPRFQASTRRALQCKTQMVRSCMVHHMGLPMPHRRSRVAWATRLLCELFIVSTFSVKLRGGTHCVGSHRAHTIHNGPRVAPIEQSRQAFRPITCNVGAKHATTTHGHAFGRGCQGF